ARGPSPKERGGRGGGAGPQGRARGSCRHQVRGSARRGWAGAARGPLRVGGLQGADRGRVHRAGGAAGGGAGARALTSALGRGWLARVAYCVTGSRHRISVRAVQTADTKAWMSPREL